MTLNDDIVNNQYYNNICIMGNKQQKNDECVFCKIAQDPSQIIGENEEYFVFHDMTKASAQ